MNLLIESRTKWIINKGFQFQFVGYLFLFIGLAIGGFYLGQLYFVNSVIEHGVSLGLPKDHAYFVIVEDMTKRLDQMFVVTSALVFLLLGVLGLQLSFRIAGPLYRLTSHLENTEGLSTYKDLKFRDKDFFQEVPPVVNNFVRKVKKSA